MKSPHLSPIVIKFLNELRLNNNRQWFQDHKQEFDSAKTNFTQFMIHLSEEVAMFDAQVESALQDPQTVKVFRIYRDVRFSPDKTPYKTNFGGVIAPYGMKSGHAGYYLHLSPGDSFAGGGIHLPNTKILHKIRLHIDQNATQLEQVVTQSEFKKTFGSLDAQGSLKTIPRGFSKNHPSASFLRLKSFTAGVSYKDSQLTKPNLFTSILNNFQTLHPLVSYLNSILRA